MKSQKLIVTTSIEHFSEKARFGGKSFLPKSIPWPKNSNEEKLSLIFSIPTCFINKFCGTTLEKDKWISVFSTYNEDYFLDCVMYDEDVVDNYTKVIIHEKSDVRNESETEFSSFLLEVENIKFGETKIGGTPKYLQNKVSEVENATFCFQFYGSDLPVEDILYLSDAIGYLFVSQENEGFFFGQCT